MKALGLPLIACVFAWTVPVAVQDASVEITQAALNKLVQRVGPFSNAGVYKPSSPAGNTGSLFGRCEYVGTWTVRRHLAGMNDVLW